MEQNELEKLLKIASERLGTSPEQLKQGAQQGELSQLISNLDPVDAQSLQRVDRKSVV